MSIKSLGLCLSLLGLTASENLRYIPPGSYPSGTDRAEASAKTEAVAKTGPEHVKLAALAGTWDLTFRIRWSKDDEWQTETGTATGKTILGGRYLLEELNCNLGGQPYQGIRIHGFDNMEKHYFTIWFDTLSTWPVQSRGTVDADGIVRFHGRMKDVVTPGGRPFRTVLKRDSNDKWYLELFDTIDNEEVKIIEATYIRR